MSRRSFENQLHGSAITKFQACPTPDRERERERERTKISNFLRLRKERHSSNCSDSVKIAEESINQSVIVHSSWLLLSPGVFRQAKLMHVLLPRPLNHLLSPSFTANLTRKRAPHTPPPRFSRSRGPDTDTVDSTQLTYVYLHSAWRIIYWTVIYEIDIINWILNVEC